MPQMIKFPSIDDFKRISKYVQQRAQYVDKDENGEVIVNRTAIAPTLTFHGTVKLHGTNAAVCFNQVDGLWCQSRERIISVGSDNAGFAAYVEANKFEFLRIINQFSVDNQLDLSTTTLCVYGEWCGGSIQKGVALNQLPKMFVVFGIKLVTTDESEESEGIWINYNSFHDESINCYNIEQFPTFDIDIDFNNPLLYQNKLIELTTKVEEECPVGKYFGVSGIGEGIVFSHTLPDGSVYRFKSKGEKHANSKVRTLTEVDDEKEQLKLDIAAKITPVWRIDQAIQETFDTLNGGTLDVTKIGAVIKWVNTDILKEELITIQESGLTFKELSSDVSRLTKERFFEQYNAN
jgi:hypothetical protein